MSKAKFIEEMMNFLPEDLSASQIKAVTQFCSNLFDNCSLIDMPNRLGKAKERVKELEKNVQKLESEVCVLLGRYGDIWYEGFKSAQEDQKNMNIGCITEISPDEVLAMSEAAETGYLKQAASKNAEHPRQRALNKFALEQKIEALEECVGVCGFLSCEDSLKARIKQLRKGGE